MSDPKSQIPSHPRIEISPHLTLQPPLTRRGTGPGLILVLDHYAPLETSEKTVDPPPLIKWAEEGYCVAQILVPGKPEDGGEFPLKRAVDELTKLDECTGEVIGVVRMFLSFPLQKKIPILDPFRVVWCEIGMKNLG